MEQRILTLGTITRAIRARKLLAAGRIPSRMVKTAGTAASGCAYGLEVNATDLPAAMRILEENGMTYEWQKHG